MNKHLSRMLDAGLPFGIAMGVAFSIQHGSLNAALAGVLSGIPFGALMAFYLWRNERRLRKFGIDATDMSPTQTRTIELSATPTEALERARQALQSIPRLKVASIQESAESLSARTRPGWHCFGEDIAVQVVGRDGGCTVTVTSTPRVRSTTVDGGKGLENVEYFARALRGAPRS